MDVIDRLIVADTSGQAVCVKRRYEPPLGVIFQKSTPNV